MTIPLGGSGGLFHRLGHLVGASFANLSSANDPLYFVGTTMPAKIVTVQADYAASVASPATIEGIEKDFTSFQKAQSSWVSALAGYFEQTIIDMANLDQGILAPATLSLADSLEILIAQMGSATATVQQSSPSAGAQTAIATPAGAPIFIVSVLDPATGKNRQYIYQETLQIICTNDGQSSSGVLNTEPFNVSAIPVGLGKGNSLAVNWPNGSGVNTNITLNDATASKSGGNLLTNSDFETWTTPASQPPDGWTLAAGSVTPTVRRGTTAYTGSYCLDFVGDASTLPSITQAVTLAPLTTYAVNLFTEVSVVPAAGVLKIELIDGNSTVINDANSAANALSITLSSETTSFASHQAFFRTPAVMPAIVSLRVRESTALSSGTTLHIDHLCLTEADELYTGGPFIAGFSTAIPPIKGDGWTSAVTTTWGKFQEAFQRVCDMNSLRQTLPFSGSPTIGDSSIA